MIRCIAVDDEPKALSIIKSHSKKIPFIKLEASFVNPFEAISYISEHEVDLIFLDINMPEITGLDLIKTMRKAPLIIFTTAHSEYAVASYEVNAIDYLLKPFDFPRFLTAVSKVQDHLTKNTVLKSDFFFVNTGKEKEKLHFNDICFIESDGNYIRYNCTNSRTLVRSSFKECLKILPESIFIQVHRSYIISLKWVDKIEDNHLIISDKKIPVSASYKNKLQERINSLNH